MSPNLQLVDLVPAQWDHKNISMSAK